VISSPGRNGGVGRNGRKSGNRSEGMGSKRDLNKENAIVREVGGSSPPPLTAIEGEKKG